MKRLFGLTSLLVLAFLVRFLYLPDLPNGLHWDEMDTGYQAWSLLTTGRDYFGNSLPLLVHSIADYRTPVFIYSAVPVIKIFGLSAFSVRIISVIFGTISVLLIYLLARQLFTDRRLLWFAPLTLALSPWHVLYSRQSVECNVMLMFLLLGLVTFYKSLKRPSWLWVSALSFGLTIASYSPAKMFIPLLMLFLLISNYRYFLSLSKLYLLLSVIIFSLIAGPIIYDGSFGKSALRFHDVSIFTDPQTASHVNWDRQYSLVGSGVDIKPGMGTRLIDKFMFNKPFEYIQTFSHNYLGVFSPQYLFLTGDTELRHSPGKEVLGQFHLLEILPFIFGVIAILLKFRVSTSTALLIVFWLVVGAIPSALTRGGGPHAARTFLMLPAFVLTITLGIKYIAEKNRLFLLSYGILFVGSVIWFLGYFFNTYRLESAAPFQWGYDQVIALANRESPKYDRVVVDLREDSGLMAYLFYTPVLPADFQAMYPLPVVDFIPGVAGNPVGNILLLSPGYRNWHDVLDSGHYQGNNLIISSAKQSLLDKMPSISEIKYPDASPAFISFTKK